jgi:hypothetical protein
VTQIEFNGQLLVAVGLIASILIPFGTIMVRLNTTLNRLSFTMDVIQRRVDNHDIRLDAQDDMIRDIELNCARKGHSDRNKESRL